MRQTRGVRYFVIIRHCKATPAPPGGDDYVRPLAPRGREQADQLAAWIKERRAQWGDVTALVSSAKRTQETFQLGVSPSGLVVTKHDSDLIYNGRREVSADDVLIDVAAVDPVTTSLMVVGHNPTLYELILTLATDIPDQFRDGFPTGSACVLRLLDNQQIGRSHYQVDEVFIPA